MKRKTPKESINEGYYLELILNVNLKKKNNKRKVCEIGTKIKNESISKTVIDFAFEDLALDVWDRLTADKYPEYSKHNQNKK